MWQLNDRKAQLQVAGFSADLHLARPFDGLGQWCRDGQSLPLQGLLGVNHREFAANEASPPSDAYVRGGDLIATYPETAERNFALQIYWRILADDRAVEHVRLGLELIVSVQTELLDSQPRLTVASGLSASEIWQMSGDDDGGRFARVQPPCELVANSNPALFVCRLPQRAESYSEMIFPSDFAGTELTQDSAAAVPTTWLRSWLFPDPLEKGVIRRGRLRSYFVDRDRDLESAAALHQRFRRSAIPLTT